MRLPELVLRVLGVLGGVPNRIDVGMCSAAEGILSISRRRSEMEAGVHE